MSDATAIDGVEATDVAAGYVYTLTADSGYRPTHTGRISATRHGIVCRALAGKFDDYEQLAEQRAELLALLKTTRDVLGVALMSAAPDFFENDADVASHSVVKSIDAAIARATGAAS